MGIIQHIIIYRQPFSSMASAWITDETTFQDHTDNISW